MVGVRKVPVVMQLEALECGAACLCMVLAHHKKWIPLEQVRRDCGVSRDGSSAVNVLKAARSYGCSGKGYRFEPKRLLENVVKFPCIVHWNFNHFVVLCGFHGNKVFLNDPAKGEMVVSFEEFDTAFTGIVLEVVPGPEFMADGKPKSVFSFAKKRLKGAKTIFAFTVVAGLVTTLFSIIQPGFARVFMERLLTGQNPDWLLAFVLGFGGFAALVSLFQFFSESQQLKIEGKLAIEANSRFLWHVIRLPMDFFSQRMVGDVAMRQFDNERVASSLISKIAPLGLNFAMLVFYLFVMVRYSPLLTWVGLSSMVINVALARIATQKRVNVMRAYMRDAGKLSGITVSAVEMMESIKSSGAEHGFFERWAGYQALVSNSMVRFAKVNLYLGSLPNFLSGLNNIIILIIGTSLVMQGQFTVGMILAFQGFLAAFLAPAQSFISVGQSFGEMRTQMERIEDVLQYETDVQEAGIQEAPEEKTQYNKLRGAIELKNVSFGYAPLSEPLIQDFSMRIEPGKRVAFVGASGCGKSTLTKLISGLYKPWSGEILFDGKPMAEIDRNEFVYSVAVVDQDITLFEDSIENNIKMWDKSIEDFEVILAARDAQLHEDILAREGGYQYRILEGGQDFSGGQRQRMEIARVLAQDPTVIILDEATSALDAKTEYEVVKSIGDRGVTNIVVAHRLSTIRDCDEIIVLKEGRAVERGTHSELCAKGGLYTELVCSE